MSLIVSISSLKGGVGKTSVTLGLASAALASGKNVLVVDMDPHADASTGLAIGAGGTDIGVMLTSPKKFKVSEESVSSGWNTIAESYRIEAQLLAQSEAEQNDRAEDSTDIVDEQAPENLDAPENQVPLSDADEQDPAVAEEEEENFSAEANTADEDEATEDSVEESAETTQTAANESESNEELESAKEQTEETPDEEETPHPAEEINESSPAPAFAHYGPVGSIEVLRGSSASTAIESLSQRKTLPRLRQLLEGASESYDLILIDCPPTLGRLTSMAWAASDRVISIAEPSLFSVAGTERTLRAIARFESHSKYSVESASVVVNMIDPNNPEHAFRINEMRDIFGALVAEPAIPEFPEFQRIQGSAYPVHFWPEPQAQEFARILSVLLDGLLR